jgi:peptidoglycan L-alanyl-D-glutamate endopeptidase CwlK
VKAAAVREGVPIVWGGDWKSLRDGPHFELERKAYP